MKLNIVKTRNAWVQAYEINFGSDVLAWINVKQDNITYYCTSPIEDLDAVLNPFVTDIHFDNFEGAINFAILKITQWSDTLTSELKEFNIETLEMEEEPYIPSAGAMYGS